MQQYLRRSYLDTRLYTGPSRINGTGVLTRAPIRKGETVMIWGGVPVPRKDFDETKFRFESIVPIDELTYLGLPVEDMQGTLDEFLNHSCDSNTWMNDEVTIVARRDIATSEEITLDASLWDADSEYPYLSSGRCTCGSEHCRVSITPTDWQNPAVQARYAGHFSPYIQRKIDALRAGKKR